MSRSSLAGTDFSASIQRLLQSGRLGDAEADCRDLLARSPNHPDALLWLGEIARRCQQPAPARALLEKALTVAPDNPYTYNSLGLVFQQLGDYAAMRARLERAVALAPSSFEYVFNLAYACILCGDNNGAATHYRRASEMDARSAAALYGLGYALMQLGRTGEAAAALERAIALRADYAEAHNDLGTVRQAEGKPTEAEACYRKALGLKPGYFDPCFNLGALRQEQGEIDDARGYFEKAQAVRPDPGLKLRIALLLPPIAPGREAMREQRARLHGAIEEFGREGLKLNDPFIQVGVTHFYMAFEGENDRRAQEALAACYLKACPSLGWSAPGAAERKPSGRLKVGFCSAYFYDHTIAKMMQGLLERLPRERFDLRLYALPGGRDHVTEVLENAVEKTLQVPRKLEVARNMLAAEALDVLFYPEIGMDSFTYFLAFARLAPVQCATFGHPVTTGIPNMDYFLSSTLIEPEGAQEAYSERLVALSDMPTYYYRPRMENPPLGRAWFGLAEDRRVYLCPQSLFKIHPEFDAILQSILRRDPEGLVVLMEGNHPHWTARLRARFEAAMPDEVSRVTFLPRVPREEFLSLLSCADVLLDPLHFGGGNTTHEALALGIPVVTLPGAHMRGRITLGCYRKMGMTELVASSPEEYVEIACRVAQDHPWREELQRALRERGGAIFENQAAVDEIGRFLLAASEAAEKKESLAGWTI